MRQSKDLYQCQMIARGQIMSPEIPAEAVEAQGDGDAGKVIVDTFFGALLKHAKSRGEDEVVVLERAHALVKSAWQGLCHRFFIPQMDFSDIWLGL